MCSRNFNTLFLILSIMIPFVSIFLFYCLYSPSMPFSASFCRTAVFSSSVRKLFSCELLSFVACVTVRVHARVLSSVFELIKKSRRRKIKQITCQKSCYKSSDISPPTFYTFLFICVCQHNRKTSRFMISKYFVINMSPKYFSNIYFCEFQNLGFQHGFRFPMLAFFNHFHSNKAIIILGRSGFTGIEWGLEEFLEERTINEKCAKREKMSIVVAFKILKIVFIMERSLTGD